MLLGIGSWLQIVRPQLMPWPAKKAARDGRGGAGVRLQTWTVHEARLFFKAGAPPGLYKKNASRRVRSFLQAVFQSSTHVHHGHMLAAARRLLPARQFVRACTINPDTHWPDGNPKKFTGKEQWKNWRCFRNLPTRVFNTDRGLLSTPTCAKLRYASLSP